jgi:hypothetical protein
MQRLRRRCIATQPTEATSDLSELTRLLAAPSEHYYLLYMRKSDCKSGAFSKTAARPRPDLE